MDKYFEQAIKNINYYIGKCKVDLSINECKYDKYWTQRFGGAWYTFKLIESKFIMKNLIKFLKFKFQVIKSIMDTKLEIWKV
jgi:hypothetical protein